MAKSNSKRNTHSDKFPLTLHPTGQYCKKIKGKLYYFGSDKKKTLQRYLDQATDLHTGRSPRPDSTGADITIFALCNLYLEHQESKVQVEELTAHHYDDQINSLRIFVRFLWRHRQLNDISTLDLQNYKKTAKGIWFSTQDQFEHSNYESDVPLGNKERCDREHPQH